MHLEHHPDNIPVFFCRRVQVMELFFQEFGQGRPLVILHGLLGDSGNWRNVAVQMAEERRVITVDLRNHGRSFHHTDCSYQVMAQDVLQLADRLKLSSFDLMGHSMGGKTAMHLALHKGQRIDRLAVVDISPKAYENRHQSVFAALESVALDSLSNRKEAEQTLMGALNDVGVVQFLLKGLYKNDQGNFQWRYNLAGLKAGYDHLSLAPQTESSQPFSNPTLFIKGGNSDYIQAGDQQETLRWFPKAQAKIIADAGHWPHVEKNRLFLNIVERFFTP